MIQFLMPYFSLWHLHKHLAGLTFTFVPHNAQPPMTHHLTYAYRLTHPYLPSHMTPSQWVIPYPSLLMANIMENPSELIYHSYWLLIYSISTCTPIYLLINSSLADGYSIVLPIVLLSSHWMIATIYLQSHSRLSTYISTCTYARDGQLGDLYHLLCFQVWDWRPGSPPTPSVKLVIDSYNQLCKQHCKPWTLPTWIWHQPQTSLSHR